MTSYDDAAIPCGDYLHTAPYVLLALWHWFHASVPRLGSRRRFAGSTAQFLLASDCTLHTEWQPRVWGERFETALCDTENM